MFLAISKYHFMRWGTYMYVYTSNCEFVRINLHVLHIIGNTKLIINTLYVLLHSYGNCVLLLKCSADSLQITIKYSKLNRSFRRWKTCNQSIQINTNVHLYLYVCGFTFWSQYSFWTVFTIKQNTVHISKP